MQLSLFVNPTAQNLFHLGAMVEKLFSEVFCREKQVMTFGRAYLN